MDRPLHNQEILALFSAKKKDDLCTITETAFDITLRNKKPINLTSTVHITNQCSVMPRCTYCGFAAGTSPAGYYHPFYRTEDEIYHAVKIIEGSGIPRVSCSGAHGFKGEHAINAARVVKENTTLELLINVGSDLTEHALEKIAGYGTDTLCCNLETVNETLFNRVKPGERLQERIKVCNMISERGIELSSGLLIGLGESYEDRIHHLNLLKSLPGLGEIPIMGFNPYKGTPMEKHPPCSLREQMITIAVTRILFPDIRITVPTPTIGPENVKFSLMAGADNLATVIPENYPLEIKGVGSPAYGTLEKVLAVIDEMGLKSRIKPVPDVMKRQVAAS